MNVVTLLGAVLCTIIMLLVSIVALEITSKLGDSKIMIGINHWLVVAIQVVLCTLLIYVFTHAVLEILIWFLATIG